MNIPYTVLRTEMFGEEDWSIAVKKEHASRMPKGFKMEYFQHHSSEDTSAYEKQYPYTDIRYFVPNRDRLDEILCDISTGALRKRFTGILGDVYEGALSLKEVVNEERQKKSRFEKAKAFHQSNLDKIIGYRPRHDYKMKAIKDLKDKFEEVEIARILSLDIQTVRKNTGYEKQPSREESMILKEKRKRLARSMYAKGESVDNIATWLDVVPETVKRYLGSQYNRNRNSDLKMEKIVQLTRKGFTTYQIGQQIGMDRTTVQHYLRRFDGEIIYECDEYDHDFKRRLMAVHETVDNLRNLAVIMRCNQYKVKYYLENEA